MISMRPAILAAMLGIACCGPPPAPEPITTRRRWLLALLGLFVAYNCLMPLRHFLYPGEVSWTEEGHRFSWHMKLRDKELDEAVFEARAADGTVTELDPRDCLTKRQAEKMVLTPDMILQYCHHVAEELRHLADGVAAAAADVDCQTGHARRLQGQTARAGDVVDTDEVAPLQTVLENQRRSVVEEARGKDREHTGVGIGQGLARPEHVEEARHDDRHTVDARERTAVELARELGRGIRRERVLAQALVLLLALPITGTGCGGDIGAIDVIDKPFRPDELKTAVSRAIAPEADDAVQEAWLHVSRAGASGVENLRVWLTTIVARVCLDMLRSRKAHPSDPIEAAFDAEPDQGAVDPEHEVEMADSFNSAEPHAEASTARADRRVSILYVRMADIRLPFYEEGFG